jgi:hypothetical protein
VPLVIDVGALSQKRVKKLSSLPPTRLARLTLVPVGFEGAEKRFPKTGTDSRIVRLGQDRWFMRKLEPVFRRVNGGHGTKKIGARSEGIGHSSTGPIFIVTGRFAIETSVELKHRLQEAARQSKRCHKLKLIGASVLGLAAVLLALREAFPQGSPLGWILGQLVKLV